MKKAGLTWDNIKKLEDHHISYLLYKEGKSIETIALIRKLPKIEIENHIIKCKIELKGSDTDDDLLVEVISLEKNKRLKLLSKLSREEKSDLTEQIMKRYVQFKNPEDRMILIWLIGELKDKRLLPFLRMELKSNLINNRRLACSALGKIKEKSTKEWLEKAIEDSNPQVRQYAIKALGELGDFTTLEKLEKLLTKEKKEYVIRAAKETIEKIKCS